MRNKFLAIVLGLTSALGVATTANAGTKIYTPNFPIVGMKTEVEITPFNLVTGAYQGRFVDYGIASFAAFDQQVAIGKITGKDLVRAAYMDYRATYEDVTGQTDLIKDVDQFLEGYRKGRN